METYKQPLQSGGSEMMPFTPVMEQKVLKLIDEIIKKGLTEQNVVSEERPDEKPVMKIVTEEGKDKIIISKVYTVNDTRYFVGIVAPEGM